MVGMTAGGERMSLSGACCQPAHSLLYTINYMKQLIDMRELKQPQQTGCDTIEHNLAVSAKRLEASAKRAQATTIDELKCRLSITIRSCPLCTRWTSLALNSGAR